MRVQRPTDLIFCWNSLYVFSFSRAWLRPYYVLRTNWKKYEFPKFHRSFHNCASSVWYLRMTSKTSIWFVVCVLCGTVFFVCRNRFPNSYTTSFHMIYIRQLRQKHTYPLMRNSCMDIAQIQFTVLLNFIDVILLSCRECRRNFDCNKWKQHFGLIKIDYCRKTIHFASCGPN